MTGRTRSYDLIECGHLCFCWKALPRRLEIGLLARDWTTGEGDELLRDIAGPVVSV